jgi:hypothetical protein
VPELFALPSDGEPLGPATVLDALEEAFAAGASTLAVPCKRLDPALFDLRSGVAGEIVQKFVTYRIRLVILGPLPPSAQKSAAFAAFVRESNRGSQVWFVDSMDGLRDRLAEP